MLRQHVDAAKALAAAHEYIDLADIFEVFRDSGSTAVSGNYLVLTVTIRGYAGERNTAPEDVAGDYSVEVKWRVVTVDAAGLVDLVDALRTQFVGQRLEVPGRACSPFTGDMDDARHDSNARLFYQDIYFDTVSSRAAATT